MGSDFTTVDSHNEAIFLVVSPFFPWPLDHGDALRRYEVIEQVSALGATHVACLRRPNTRKSDISEYGRISAAEQIYVANPSRFAKTGIPGSLARVTMGLRKGSPPWLFRLFSPELHQMIEGIDKASITTVILLGEAAGLVAPEIRRAIPNARVIWDKSNVLSASDLGAVRAKGDWRVRLRGAVTLPFSFLFESRTVKLVDEIWLTTSVELERIRAFFSPRNIHVVPSAIYDGPKCNNFDVESNTLLWMSSLDYPPNWSGLQRVVEALDDYMSKRSLVLRVVGGGSSERQKEWLARYPWIDFVGYAHDLYAACSGVRAGIVPLWAGAGLKLKTLSLASMQVPIIATEAALEGVPPQVALRMPQHPADFIESIEEILSMDESQIRSYQAQCEKVLTSALSRSSMSDAIRRRLNTNSG